MEKLITAIALNVIMGALCVFLWNTGGVADMLGIDRVAYHHGISLFFLCIVVKNELFSFAKVGESK